MPKSPEQRHRPYRPVNYLTYARHIMQGEFTPQGIIIDAPIRTRVIIPRATTPSRQQGNARLPNVNAGSR